MINDEERREVAENLRMTIGSSIQYKEQFFDELAEVVVGFEDYHDFDVVLEKLADLIDRPTCKLVEAWDGEREQHYLDCTACHFGRRAIEQDDAGGWYNARELWCNVEYDDLTHCPYCGAEVVRDGD